MAGNATFFEDEAWCFSRLQITPTPQDDMESYTDLVAVNGLNGGLSWPSGYVDRASILGLQALDDMENYTDLAAVNGLNGGSGWSVAYVDR